MKLIDRFNELEAFGESKTVDSILRFVYQNRIYIENVLDESFPQDILDATMKFLEVDEYDGDELKSWERYLLTDIEELLN